MSMTVKFLVSSDLKVQKNHNNLNALLPNIKNWWGNANIGGYDIGKKEDSMKIRKIIRLVSDNVELSKNLTAYDKLDFLGKIHDCSKS